MLYIIAIEYGQWSDFTSKDILATTDEHDALGAMNSIKERVEGICEAAREVYSFNGTNPFQVWANSEDALERIVGGVHDDHMSLVLYRMPMNQITDNREVVKREHVEIFSWGDFEPLDIISKVDHNDPLTKFESMAFTYESHLYGWRVY